MGGGPGGGFQLFLETGEHSSAFTDPLKTKVHADTIEPVVKAGTELELGELLEGGEENILRDIFGVRILVSQEIDRGSVDSFLVGIVKIPISLIVLGEKFLYEFPVFQNRLL